MVLGHHVDSSPEVSYMSRLSSVQTRAAEATEKWRGPD